MSAQADRAFLDLLRETFGLSLPQAGGILRAVRATGADPVLAACRLDAQALAIHVRGGPDARAAWNDARARRQAEALQGEPHQTLRAMAKAIAAGAHAR